MAALLPHSRNDDSELARRVSTGDPTAFATLDERHRHALTRYARGLLRRSEHDAEDVVQDVLIRAHQALRAGHLPDELRPWLYRLTRNRAIDEVRRKRWGDESLDAEHTSIDASRQDPDTVLTRKEAVRRLVDDLADLPVRQREVLLARELDDQTAAQVAARFGVTVSAAHKLANRARENLIKTRAARDAGCPDIRATLLDAHERGVRPTEHALRHVKECEACRAYQRDVRRLSKQLHALNPAFGLPVLGAVLKLAGGGGAKTAVGIATVLAVAATGGVVVLKSAVHHSGDPSPFRLAGIRDANGRPVTRGAAVPGRTAVVTALVNIPPRQATSTTPPTVTLPCPENMRFAGYAEPERRGPFFWQAMPETIPGYSTKVQIDLDQHGLKRVVKGTIAIICMRPDANGSISDHPRKLQPGERLAHVCPNHRQVRHYASPGQRLPQGDLTGGEPVAVQRRSASGTWTLVGHDPGLDRIAARPGWIRTSQLCP
jgi:RNA polymerase sigma factor (sigma-70 family)